MNLSNLSPGPVFHSVKENLGSANAMFVTVIGKASIFYT